MKAARSTLTERGQVSVPASIRRELGVKVGQILRWEKVSARECRVTVEDDGKPLGAGAMRGFMKQFRRGRGWPRTSKGWMRLLREGEVD